MTCQARQYSDQMQCGRCGLAWDVSDPEPPRCSPRPAPLPISRPEHDVAEAEHKARLAGVRRQHELLEAEHAVCLAVARWRVENPALASQWLGKPADIAQAATNSVADAYRLNTAGSVAVATDTYWNEDMAAAPRGVKLQLLSAGGVAQYDNYRGEAFWVGWAPVPRRRPL